MLPPGEKFNVRDYGAKGDGSTLDTLAIQRALDAAEGKGGVVVVPEGTYLTKQVQLRSDTMLWLDKNAVLLASQNYATYPHVVPCESLVAVRNTGRALVYAERARNISISGGGELNANGRCRFKVNDPKGINKLYTSRPDNLYMACCEDIRVSDVRFTSAAYWTLVPLSSRFVTLEHLMLEEAKLWLDSGIIFGPETAQFERFNVACPRVTLEQALTQLKDALDKHLAAK